MISLDIKSEPKTTSPLSLSAKNDEPKLSFSELLKGANTKNDSKVVQNGTLVLSLNDKEAQLKPSAKTVTNIPSKETLSSLLKGSEVTKSDEKKAPILNKESVELNPKLMQNLSVAEIKTLISDAKVYLKEKIEQSDGYKKSQIKELPSTLKGLAAVAKKFNIDISKITVEEVQVKNVKAELPKQEILGVQVSKEIPKDTVKTQVQTLKEVMKAEEPKDVKTEIAVHKEAVKTDTAKIQEAVKIQETVKVQAQGLKEAISVDLSKTDTLSHSDKKSLKAEDASLLKTDTKAKIPKNTEALHVNEANSETAKVEEKKTEQIKQPAQLKETPLFKAHERTEHTTEQLVQTKQFKTEEKTPKQKADETLKLLLRGEKPTLSTQVLTPDFSVATAKVLAPNAPTEAAKSFEQLLRGEEKESTTASKLDGLTAHKADSLEVKVNEAKQMIKYLSSDVKSAIEDYKSPFTRIKVQLNPQRLGEVDLTIVQRGKNLHVNISSNNTAINTLVMNANELKTQLSNNGIQNATLNFSNNSQGDNSSSFGGQQQSRQNEQKAREEYNYFNEEEANEEILSSLEIIVSHYA
ncbi:flagellar hook-length control protein FliK [bacterium]|nr:flagellar hook-length control protein FliK [bacterium]MBU1433631.1 flagellar hook-length control protein FliK [bacterium]MBU1503188.1 flagellar hook-length control protein FliK [bacterium]